MKKLYELFAEAKAIVEDCGIETGIITDVTINRRAKKRFGQCKYNGYTGTYSINISEFILADDVDTHATMETIIHEILHTCDGCMNHGKLWKRYAEIIRVNTGFNVTRTSSYEKFGLERPQTKKENYVFVCEDCGQVIRRDRMSKFVKNYHHYRCGKCGGHLRFDSENSKMELWTANPRLKAVSELADRISHE